LEGQTPKRLESEIRRNIYRWSTWIPGYIADGLADRLSGKKKKTAAQITLHPAQRSRHCRRQRGPEQGTRRHIVGCSAPPTTQHAWGYDAGTGNSSKAATLGANTHPHYFCGNAPCVPSCPTNVPLGSSGSGVFLDYAPHLHTFCPGGKRWWKLVRSRSGVCQTSHLTPAPWRRVPCVPLGPPIR